MLRKMSRFWLLQLEVEVEFEQLEFVRALTAWITCWLAGLLTDWLDYWLAVWTTGWLGIVCIRPSALGHNIPRPARTGGQGTQAAHAGWNAGRIWSRFHFLSRRKQKLEKFRSPFSGLPVWFLVVCFQPLAVAFIFCGESAGSSRPCDALWCPQMPRNAPYWSNTLHGPMDDVRMRWAVYEWLYLFIYLTKFE